MDMGSKRPKKMESVKTAMETVYELPIMRHKGK